MFPRMMRIRQHFDAPTVDDIPGTIHTEMTGLQLQGRVRKGESVAISVGSRGISNIALIVKTLADEIKALGAEPFVVPAMGSHGGGTAEGQQKIVESYGVTEDVTGSPIRSSMEVVQIGETTDGVPVFFDKHAYEADHVVVAARIKPHTGFAGEIESGLHKMMLIGLGKHHGASLYHQAIVHYTFDQIVRSVAQTIIDKCGILCGLAIVENQYDRTALLKAVAPEDFLEEEKKLLVLSKEWMPRLPFDRADLLVIDEMGKNISGSGIDTNVVGRKKLGERAADDEFPKITRLYVRGLTEETHGNAAGIGLVEYAHTRLIEGMNLEETNINCITGNHPVAAHIPIHYDTDRRVLELALGTVGLVEPDKSRLIRIHNTLDIEEILVSEAYLPEVEERDSLEIVEPLKDMELDDRGDLLPF